VEEDLCTSPLDATKKEKGLVRKGTVQEATAEGCNFLKTSNYPKSGIKNFPFRLRPIG